MAKDSKASLESITVKFSDRSVELANNIESGRRSWGDGPPPPRLLPATTTLGALLRVARLRTSLALTAPAVSAAVLAWWQAGNEWQILPLIFALIGTLSSAIGLNMLTEFHDYRRSLMLSEQSSNPYPTTGFDILASRRISPGFAHSIALFAIVLSGLCMAWSSILVGWPLFFFGALSLLLTVTYASPPIQYAYRHWGFGELGVWLNFGLLQMLIGYYAQASTLTWTPFWLSIPFGLLAVLSVHNFNFIYHRRDWLIHKRTIVVQLGTERAVDLSSVLVVAAFAAFLLIASLAVMPLRVLVTLFALPTAVSVFQRIDREMMDLHEGIALSRSTANATLLTSLLFCVILIIERM